MLRTYTASPGINTLALTVKVGSRAPLLRWPKSNARVPAEKTPERPEPSLKVGEVAPIRR